VANIKPMAEIKRLRKNICLLENKNTRLCSSNTHSFFISEKRRPSISLSSAALPPGHRRPIFGTKRVCCFLVSGWVSHYQISFKFPIETLIKYEFANMGHHTISNLR